MTVTTEAPGLPDLSDVPLTAIGPDAIKAAIARILPDAEREPVPVASFGSAI